jgi:hypothetical protein
MSDWLLALALLLAACVVLGGSAVSAQESAAGATAGKGRGKSGARARASKPTPDAREKQSDAKTGAKRAKRGRAPMPSASSSDAATAGTSPPSPEPASAAPPAARERVPSSGAGDAAAISSEADEAVRKEGDSEIKTVEFSGLDIEGQLKTPQMLYFLNRLRAEFDRPELPHRSFMPELQRGTKEPAF